MKKEKKKKFDYKIICRCCGKVFEPFLKHNFNFTHQCPYCDESNTYEENALLS